MDGVARTPRHHRPLRYAPCAVAWAIRPRRGSELAQGVALSYASLVTEEDRGLEAARAARRKALRLFEQLELVCAVGIAREHGVHVVKVSLEAEPDAALELPAQIDGVPVVVEVAGKLRAQTPR